MLAVERTIISQYDTDPVLTVLLDLVNQSIDPTVNLDGFYDYVWNVATAQGFGLDIWGRIVDVGRVLQVASGELSFGFEEATTLSASPFNQGTFYPGGGLTSNYALTDPAYRILIYAKALTNISDGSILSCNQVLNLLFTGRGSCYCTDGLDQTMTYTFNFPLSPVELAIVSQANVLPTPAGVISSIVVI